MNNKKLLKNQQGFTLIEIIAVLVLLGILAAVAVPKFLDMQTTAQVKAVDGALAAAVSNATMAYSSYVLENSAAPSALSDLTIATNLGDFTASYTGNLGACIVTITASTQGWFADSDATKSKTIPLQ